MISPSVLTLVLILYPIQKWISNLIGRMDRNVEQGELFHDVQPFVQLALDDYTVSIFSYGQTRSRQTHTMEGSSYDRGLHVRSFEELFDLSNSDTTSAIWFNFYVTIVELYNEQVPFTFMSS
ncbi:kinesin-like protein KIN-14L [Macadamia integrifolia]|uniref:kinesin-like protein KIN-14L n=1 Tax=Macadamia integrifolia TaxID=60698 RepID=UPI001C4EC111|nr:kinesin-like protein KIN-14L [Macadamia integrifolia]